MLRSPIDNEQHHPSTAYTLWSLSVTAARRKYKWAFIGDFLISRYHLYHLWSLMPSSTHTCHQGTIKRDRAYAVNTFSSWTSAPHFLSNVSLDQLTTLTLISSDPYQTLGVDSLHTTTIPRLTLASIVTVTVGDGRSVGDGSNLQQHRFYHSWTRLDKSGLLSNLRSNNRRCVSSRP